MVEALSNELWAQVFSFLDEAEMFTRVPPTCHKLCGAVRDSIETVILDASGAAADAPGTLSRHFNKKHIKAFFCEFFDTKICQRIRLVKETCGEDYSSAPKSKSFLYMIGIDPCMFPRALSGTLSCQAYNEIFDDKTNLLTDSNLCSFRRLVDYANLRSLTIRNVRGRDCWMRIVEPLRRATRSRVRNVLFERCIMDPIFVHFLSSILPHFIDLRVLRFEQCIFFPSTMRNSYLSRLWHSQDGRVPARKRSHCIMTNDRIYVGKYSDAFLRLINAIGRTGRKLENLVISECHIGAMQKMDSESTTKLGNRRLSSGNPCLDFVTDLESQARPPEKIPFRFLDGVAFNLTQTCARLRNLKRLELDENFLFDAGVYSIAQSISCGDFPVLETLSLMGNYISTFGFITLLFALKNRRKITEVDLSDNQINFVARVKEDEEAIDLDVPAMMLAFVKLWVGSSSENFHIALAGNQPCKSVEDKMAKAVQELEESKATRGVLDFQQRSVRSPSNSCFQDHDDGDEAEEDSGEGFNNESVRNLVIGSEFTGFHFVPPPCKCYGCRSGSMVVGSGSGGISSQGAVGTPADLSSLDDDDDDEEEEEEDEEDDDYMNAGLQIGLTSLAGGDERAASKRPRRRDGILEVTESEVEREASEMREIMRRNPIWRLQNEEFGSDDEDDGEFDPNGEESDQDDALSGLVSETEDFL